MWHDVVKERLKVKSSTKTTKKKWHRDAALKISHFFSAFFLSLEIDSQKRFVENDVNIHYKVPIRYEYKEPIPEEELAQQQAEHMKRVYQEERRRKYLQELQDMNSRRHTDNFTPSQKSPIALNRYDDFPTLPSSKSPVNLPGTVAKALFNFQGQSARFVANISRLEFRIHENISFCRELTFKKGDIIYIRRQIDKNWYEGEHNTRLGLLPVQYVDVRTCALNCDSISHESFSS